MPKPLHAFLLCLTVLPVLDAAPPPPQLPSVFEPNHGQAPAAYRFLTRGFRHSALLAPDAAVFSGPAGALTMRLAGASPAASLSGETPLSGQSNYFRGGDPAAWRTGIPHFAAVRARGVYPGIDVIYHGRGGAALEFDFSLAPGANPSLIRLRFDARARLNSSGELIARGIRFHRPRIFEAPLPGSPDPPREIPGRFIRSASGEFGFALARYDRSRPLLIDPLIEFTAVLSASGDDRPTAAAFDAAGNIYILGVTNSLSFPLTAPLQSQVRGEFDAFLIKLNPTGRVTLFATYLGGSSFEGAFGLAVDAQGNPWICGSTDSNNFPVTRNAFQGVSAGNRDAFVAKLNSTGSTLLFSTYLGSSGRDEANALALDGAGNAYVAGYTSSNTFPISNTAFQNPGLNGDAFLVKFTPAGSVTYSSVFGGNSFDAARALAVTASGIAYVAGQTQSRNFPLSPDARLRVPLASLEGFVARFSADGKTLDYSTFLGLPQDGGSMSLAADDAGSVYLAGSYLGSAGVKAFLALFQFASGSAKLVTADGCCGNSGVQRWNAMSLVKDAAGKAAEIHTAGFTDTAVNASPAGSADFNNCPRFGVLRGAFSPDGAPVAFGCNGGLGAPTAIAARPGAIYIAGTTDHTRDPGSASSDVLLVYLRDLDRFPQRPTAAAQDNQGTASDPVATGTGEFYYAVTDLDAGGRPGLSFERYYASYLGDNSFSSSLGANWVSNFDVRLGILGSTATLQLPRGKNVQFQRSGSLWSLAGPEQRNYQLVQTASGFQAADPASNRIYSFTSNGTLTQIQDRNGNALTVAAGPDGPLSAADAYGRKLTFTYENGRIVRVSDQAGSSVSFSYAGDLLVSATGPLGKTSRYNYAPGRGALLAEIVRPAGNSSVKQTFDARGRVLAQSDGLGNSTRFEYDRPVSSPPAGGAAAETKITDPLGNVTLHVHQAQEALLSVADAEGRPIAIAYDANHHRSSVTDRSGGVLSADYDPAGNLVAYTDANGNRTRFTFTAQQQGQLLFYNLTRVDYPDGTSVSMTYDNRGNVLVLTDQGGNRWTYSYDDRGRLSTVTSPSSGLTIYQYNSDGTLQSIRLPSGDTVAFTYDDRFRPVKAAFPDGSTRSVSYDAANRVTSITGEGGKTVALAYDDNGNLLSLTDSFSRSRSLAYDAAGRPVLVTDRLGNRLALSYNAAGALSSLAGPSGEKLSIRYDSLNRPVSLDDAAGKSTRVSFSSEGLPLTVTDAASRVWSFSSDKMGRVTRVTTPAGGNLDFTYDRVSRLVSFRDALGRASRFSYDERGLVNGFLSPGGFGTSLARSSTGTVLQIVDPNGQRWNYSYDPMGRLTQRADPLNRRINYSWDSRGRLASASYGDGALALRYDPAGNLTAQSYSAGGAQAAVEIPYSYDDANRLTDAPGVSLAYDGNGRAVASNGITLDRDASGRVAAVTYAPGKTVRYAYDERGLPVQISDWTGAAAALVWDDARQLSRIDRPNNTSTSYLYDAEGRLSSISERIGDTVSQIALQRDAAGRVTSSTRTWESTPPAPASAEVFPYNEAGQPLGDPHNGLGLPLSGPARGYRWDPAGRLISLGAANGQVSYAYDGLGSLTSRGGAGRSRTFVVNYGLPRFPVAIARDGDADRFYYVSLPDGTLLYSIDAGDSSHRYYHYDENGTTIALTTDSGAVSDTYQVSPYGEIVTRSGSTENPFTWLGRFGVLEEEDGLYWIRPRFFDSRQARYLSPSRLASIRPEDANPYVFPANPVEAALPAASEITPYVPVPAGIDDRPPQPADFFAALPGALRLPPAGPASRIPAPAISFTETATRKGPAPAVPAAPPRAAESAAPVLASCSEATAPLGLLLAAAGPFPSAGDLAALARYIAFVSAASGCPASSPDLGAAAARALP